MVCGAPLNYKWKQKGLSSAFSPEHDSDSLAQAGHGQSNTCKPVSTIRSSLVEAVLYSHICIFFFQLSCIILSSMFFSVWKSLQKNVYLTFF